MPKNKQAHGNYKGFHLKGKETPLTYDKKYHATDIPVLSYFELNLSIFRTTYNKKKTLVLRHSAETSEDLNIAGRWQKYIAIVSNIKHL